MTASIDDALASLQRASRLRESGQHGLFGGGGATETAVPFLLRDAPLWSEEERLASEYAMLGFYVPGIRWKKYSSRLAEWSVVRLEEWKGSAMAKEIAVAALIVGVRPMRSKKGARWAIFTIQDMTGVQELLAFPESFSNHEQTLKPGTPLLLKVRVQIEEAGTRLSLQEARRIARHCGKSCGPTGISCTGLDGVDDRRYPRAFSNNYSPRPRKRAKLCLELESADGSIAVLPSQQRVKASPELLEAVRKIGDKAAAAY